MDSKVQPGLKPHHSGAINDVVWWVRRPPWSGLDGTMLSLTRRTDYALVALAALAQARAQGSASHSAREIADRFGMPLPLLMNILKDLARARLVHSTRGSQGGYCLAAEPTQIRLAEIVAAIEGHAPLTPCCDSPMPIVGQGCRIADGATPCPIQTPIRRLHERLSRFFDQLTLADLLDSRVDVPLTRTAPTAAEACS